MYAHYYCTLSTEPATVPARGPSPRSGDKYEVLSFPTVDELQRRGHPVRPVGEFDDVMGHAQAIWIDRDEGALHGGADPRGEGLALGY